MKKISEDVQVTKEDQANINNFSKLYQRRQELDDSLLKTKEKINQHQDTLDQIELADDDEILRYRFGACFFHLPTVQVRELVEKDIGKVKEEQKRTQKDYDDVEKKLKKLKATLYGKFGNSINLEQ